jgi:ATP-dependent helicase/nuclease subunit B
MLEVVTGRFQPHLESALIDQIRRTKSADPFAPIAVLVPSAPLLDHIRRTLAVEHTLAVLNLHLLTFHQFAMRLADEARVRSGVAPLRVVDDLFFEQLVRHLIRNRLSGLIPLQHIGHSSGTWAAVWSTIRDLKDAGIEPASALRAVGEGCFDKDESGWLHALFSLHAAVKEAGIALEVGTADDLAASVLQYVPTSAFLASLRQVMYFGFYDLTQVQLSLFEAVSATASTILFFPLDDGPDYEFGRRFFARHVQSRVTAPPVRTGGQRSEGGTPSWSVRSVVGVEEEVASVCRTILDLCETNGYRFHEIGVAARTLDPYRATIQSTFDRHCVPFVTTAGRPLIHEPLCKLLLQLASLPANDFYRTPTLDIVSSPLFLSSRQHARSPHYRPEQWKALVSALHITHGFDEWTRLEQASRSALSLGRDTVDDAAYDVWGIAPEVIGLCWQVVSELLDECTALPQRGRLGDLIEAFRRLASRHLFRPEADPPSDDDPQTARLQSTWDTIDRVWETLHELDAIGDELSWEEFVDLLTHALERASVPLTSGACRGVAVLDAMAARGLPFKALFILGLNEKMFPRYIREDPFLRDRHRRVLETTLGFKIDEKLGGYDEERLLFALLQQSAIQRLFLSYQRADDSGRLLAPSPYLVERLRSGDQSDHTIDAVPRRLTERVARQATVRLFLPPAELARYMAMQGQDPAELLSAVGREAELFRHATETLVRLEEDTPSLTPFDGQTGPPRAHWSRVERRGIAPTPLERYARCPFQYFAADVLRLEPVRIPIAQEPDALMLGSLCHAALRRCYESLVHAGWPEHLLPEAEVSQRAAEAVAAAAEEFGAAHRTGHFLLWELAKEQVRILISAAVSADQIAQADEPYRPFAFEVEAEGTIPFPTPDGQRALKISGRVDRIDRHRDSGDLRIIDYKYKTNSAMQSEDRNLLQSAVRGFRLQPPLYSCLVFPEQGNVAQVQLFFMAPRWATSVARSTFTPVSWASKSGESLGRTINTLADGIRAGRFFIVPDNYCGHCDYRVACRREHQPTWWRAHRAPESKELRALRAIRVIDE